MRVDAARNRAHILDAARKLFAARGTDVTLRAVARQAGVGTATLSRHFPTREALIEAALGRQIDLCTGLTEEALADPDPWHGLRGMVDRVFDPRQRGHDLPIPGFDTDSPAMRNLRELTRRAQEAGALRADFEPGDLTLLLQAGDSVAATSPAAARRLVEYMLQSFSARTGPLPLV
ncbi:TetR/AcrR family transcriptional regulator [Catenuloplanes japonicus]|uniref:TetR/AcrR family transcriptional regulator n=1 Tax=Catenuloplanes japonicus TaxID=33876 RepID=UPI000525A3D9|nr:helix-turn-helix domain-containing protein [Catenuloplanes japonicus]